MCISPFDAELVTMTAECSRMIKRLKVNTQPQIKRHRLKSTENPVEPESDARVCYLSIAEPVI